MFGLILLVSSLLPASVQAEVDTTLRPIRSEKCESTESEARAVVEARLADGTALCGKGNIAKQTGGWSCKHTGCAKNQIRCVTQYTCAEGTLNLSLPGKPTPSGTPTPSATDAGPRAEPLTAPNPKLPTPAAPAGKPLPQAERRDIPNGNQVFTEEKGVDANGVPSAKVYDQKKGAPSDLKIYGNPTAPSPTAAPAPIGPTPTASPAPTAVDKAAEAATSQAVEILQKKSEALKTLEKE